MTSTLRLFVGLTLPNMVVDEVRNVQDRLQQKKLFIGRWTKPENLHLTLKFLGEIDEGLVPQLQNSLRTLKIRKFSAEIGELGVFPSAGKGIRILWVHILGDGVLNLQKLVDQVLLDHFEPENRFMSHLTIARVKSVRDRAKFLNELRKPHAKALRFTVTEFLLIRSVLTPAGPIYTPLESYPLGDLFDYSSGDYAIEP